MARSETPRRPPASTGSAGCRNPTWLLSLSAALPALVACPASAAKWDIVPTMSSVVSYTDNLALSRPGTEKADWVTQLTPGVSVTGSGSGLRVNATYGAQFVNRIRSDDSAVNHQFSASGNAEFVKQLLFVDANASVSQQNVSLFGPQADSNINVTGNRATVRTFLLSPYLRHDFGQAAQGELRFSYDTTGSDAANFARSETNRISANLASGPAYRLYTWNVAYSRENIASAGQPDITSEKIQASGKRLITSQVALTSSVGYESSNYTPLGENPKGAIWNAGFEWTPTLRTRLSAASGKRYFGNNRSFDFSHRTRLTTWSAGYSEDVTNTQSRAVLPASVSTAGVIDTLFLSSVPDPVIRQQAVRDFIAQNQLPANQIVPLNFLTSQTTLVKNWRASVGINGARNTVLTGVFTQTSEAVVAGLPASGTGDLGSGGNVRQTGANALWNWRFATQASSNLSASYSRNEVIGTSRRDDVRNVALSVNRQFLPKLSGSVSYRGVRSESSQPGAGYSENALSAALSMRF